MIHDHCRTALQRGIIESLSDGATDITDLLYELSKRFGRRVEYVDVRTELAQMLHYGIIEAEQIRLGFAMEETRTQHDSTQ